MDVDYGKFVVLQILLFQYCLKDLIVLRNRPPRRFLTQARPTKLKHKINDLKGFSCPQANFATNDDKIIQSFRKTRLNFIAKSLENLEKVKSKYFKTKI